jgi:hypothetical protein
MIIDLIYENRNMTILANGEDRKITAIDPCPNNCNYITCEIIKPMSHLRLTIPDDKVSIDDGRIVFKKSDVLYVKGLNA